MHLLITCGIKDRTLNMTEHKQVKITAGKSLYTDENT